MSNCFGFIDEIAPVSFARKGSTMILAEMELSVRTTGCLCNHIGAGPKDITLDMICKLTEEEVIRIHNFGRKSLNELKEVLHHYGRRLGDGLTGEARYAPTSAPPPEHPLHSAIMVMVEVANSKRSRLIEALRSRYNNFHMLRLALNELEQYETALDLMRRQVDKEQP